MLKIFLKNNIYLTFAVWSIVFFIIYIFSLLLINIDKTLSDTLYSNFVSKNIKISKDIIIVAIDEKTVWDKNLWRFPFSRDKYINVIENLNYAWVSVIWFDIIFADITDSETDLKFAKAIKNAWNIVLWWSTIFKNNNKIFQRPLEIFTEGALNYWYFHPKYHNNKKSYSINISEKYTNWTFYHFWIQVLRSYFYKMYWEKKLLTFNKEDEKNFYFTPTIKAFKAWANEININFNNKQSATSFYTISFWDIYNNNFDKKYFKDKIILIWATADGIKDIFFSPEWQKFGVFTHAELINTILTKNPKIYFNKILEYLLLFSLIILSVYFNILTRGKKLLISNLSIVSIFLLTLFIIVYPLQFVINFPAQFIFALILSLTVSNILKSYLEDKNKTLLNKALSQYVSKDIAQEILSGEWKVKLDWERKNISIFFSDIEGFTSISEKMNPEELVIFLREYLWAMSNIIMDERGFIDKYEWDAIMALWWVFGYKNSSTYDNCKSALLQQQKLKILNQDWKERFWEELKIRMWINTGEAIIWNIWATGRKMEFTALWDSVNLASRLEEVNKKYWTYLCVSQTVFEEQKENFDFRYLDQIRVKWKNIPIKIYELISFKWEISDLKNNIITNFEKAIKLYINKDFKKALELFIQLSNLWDNPSKTYISRCEEFIKNPPEKKWDWVWTMKTK